MPIVSSGGAMTHVVQSGHGTDRALMLHPMLADARVLEPLMAKLGDALSMIAIDLPGHGQSEDWDTSRDYAQMATEMASGMLETPSHVIGHSFGAYIALRLATEQRDKILSLTLIEPVFFAVAKEFDRDAYATYEREAKSFMQAIMVGDLVTAARLFTAVWGDGRPWEALKPDAQDYITSRMPLIAAGEPAIVSDRGNVVSGLETVTCPCLFLQGEHSPLVASTILDALEAKVPSSVRHVIEGAGHMAPLTHPDVVARHIRETLLA